jgi:cell division protein ZapA (FtsZ GTPase activity inhibitor)
MKTRHITALFASLVAALAFMGCSPKKDNPTPTSSSQPSPGGAVDRAAKSARDTVAQARDSLARTWDSVKDATYADRAQAQANLNQLAISVDAKVTELQARSASATDATKAKWNDGLAKLRSARTDLEGEIKELQSATAETWDKAKAEVASAWEKVRQAFSDLETQPAAM